MSLTYHTVVVAVDGSEVAEKAFEKAIHIAENNGARLVIGHVVDPVTSPGMEVYKGSIIESAKKYGEGLLEKYMAKAKAAGLPEVVCELELGSPKSKITKVIAKKHQADLIICGANGLNAVERFVLGSVSQYIVRHAVCDVLVVR
ncbi:universal stress protein [Bacillus testis]|uniref:universal stress protein n=1 Tax=Bacillus testis TaxID=1622072 RepID=UPI00067E8BFE|nr:universal stress protein [Bacillus testis]